MKSHYTYIVKCSDETFYTGYTTDVMRRVKEHNGSKAGARYTRYRQPVELVYVAKFSTRSDACREEARIKKLSRAQKITLMSK